MTSSADMTASGKSLRSLSRRSPASLRAMVSGANTVCSTGTSSLLPSRMSLNASSSLPRAPCPGSRGLSFAQSETYRMACCVQVLAPLGDPRYATLQPQASRGMVDFGHMAPERHGRPIHGPSAESSQDALSLGHGPSVYHFCHGELSARAMV